MSTSPRSRISASDSHERKTDRLELRVTPSAKELIQRAAALSGLTVGDIAYEGARRVLADYDQMRLSTADREALFAALLDPPEPPKRLVDALRRRRAMPG